MVPSSIVGEREGIFSWIAERAGEVFKALPLGPSSRAAPRNSGARSMVKLSHQHSVINICRLFLCMFKINTLASSLSPQKKDQKLANSGFSSLSLFMAAMADFMRSSDWSMVML